MPPALAALRGVTRSFPTADGEVEVLRGVDLDVEHRDLVRIRGPSGSGKTTLLSILGLLDGGYGGSYRFAGEEVRDAPEPRRGTWRLGQVGFAFQDLHLVPSLTAAENLAVVALAAGTDRPAAWARAESLLSSAGLGHRLRHLPGALSGGERRRVALARALVNRPRLLLLDEPTAGLDAAAAEGMAALIDAAHKDGAAVVAATHDPAFLPGARDVHVVDGRLR